MRREDYFSLRTDNCSYKAEIEERAKVSLDSRSELLVYREESLLWSMPSSLLWDDENFSRCVDLVAVS